MGKRASASGDRISSRLKRTRRRTPEDAPGHASGTSQAPQIQSHFPRVMPPRKRKTAGDAPGLRSCTTRDSQIQILPSGIEKAKGFDCNQRPFSAAAQVSVSIRSSYSSVCWGAKRLRTAVGVRRDWSDLDEGPAGLIAERVLATDVADYIRFRAVCRHWRRCCEDPRARAVLGDRRLYPRRWIMLLGEEEKLKAADAPHCVRRHFLNVSSGQCIQVHVPELRDHGVLRSTTDGLLLLVNTTTQALRLLNPLTRQVAELPHFTAGMHNPVCFIGESSTNSAGLVDKDGHHTVFLYRCGNPRTLAFAKPGDERWVLVTITEPINEPIVPTMSLGGRFYGVTSEAVMMLDTMTRGDEEEDDQPPRLVVAAKLAAQIRGMTDMAHLVENGEELMLVHRTLRRRGFDDSYRNKYKLYRVNLARGKATPASARGHAIFIGRHRTLYVHPQVFPSLTANTVYMGLNMDQRDDNNKEIGAYHLRDGSTEPLSYDSRSGLARPWSIADCLSAYVCG